MTAVLSGTNGLLQSYDYQVPTTGFSYTFAAGVQTLILNPAGTLATGTITMPASPSDGMTITFTSSQQITALTLNGNTGQTVVGAVTFLPAKAGVTYVYRTTGASWYPTTAVPVFPSMVRLNTANGYGSTNTKIRRFTNTVTNQGTDITYADSATLGASFTINTNGVYAISYTDCTNSLNWNAGISLNTTTPTTNIQSCAVGEILAATFISTADVATNVGWTGYLTASSVIRAHNAGGTVGANPNTVQFTITRVA